MKRIAKLEEEYEEVVEDFAKEHLKDIQNSANVALITTILFS
ncbi:hypothetical protein [Archaeoglobus sp.]